MNSDLRRKAEECSDCLAKRAKCKIRDSTHEPQKSGYPGEKIYIDLVRPLPETRNIQRYTLKIEDGFNKHISAFPIRN